MSQADLIISARWIIPVVPRKTVLDNHGLIIAKGRILDIIPDAAAQYPDVPAVHLPDHAVLPGLINLHTHAAMNLFRGVTDDLPLMQWLEGHIWPLEGRFVDEAFCRLGARHAIAEMLRGGVTCFNDMYFFPEATAREVRAAGIRAQLGMILLDFPSAYAASPDEYFERGLALHDACLSEDLISTCFAPHAPYTVSDAPLARCRTLADELDVPITMHVHETAHEVENAADSRRPLARLQALGLLNERLSAVHMTQLNAAEIDQVAASGAHVVHCPESNLKLASGFCPVAELSAAGINVALGTDGAASNNDLDMIGEMRTAALLGKGIAGRADALPADEVLAMATINGARALGQEDRIGSLEPGKWADLCAVDLSALEQQPLFDPISQIVYAAARHQVSDVWVAGRRVLQAGRLTRIDETALLSQVATMGEKIAQARPR